MRLILLITILGYSVSLSQVYMNIINKDGTRESIKIEDIRKLTFSGVVGIEESEKISSVIKTFTLLQNYPNPFNPSTTIEYEIPKEGYVEAKIYNINGELVKVLENQYKNGGKYRLQWDSKNKEGKIVTSGMYMMQVIYNKTALTKKIMLIK